MEFNLLINKDINDYDIDCVLNSLSLKGENFPYGEPTNEELKKINYEFEHNYERNKLFSDRNIVVEDNVNENVKVKKILTVWEEFEKNEPHSNIYFEAFRTALKLGFKSIAVFFYGESSGWKEKFDNGITDILVAVDKIQNLGKGPLKVYAMLSEKDGLMINKTIYLDDYTNSKSPFIDYYNKDNGTNDIYYCDDENTRKMNRLKNFINSLDEKKFIKIDHELTYPFEFLEILFKGNENEFNRILKECKLDRRRKNRLKNTKKLNKETVFSLSIALGLNKELTTQFLMIAGYSYSIYENLDMLVIDYFEQERIKNFELFDNNVAFFLGRHLKF